MRSLDSPNLSNLFFVDNPDLNIELRFPSFSLIDQRELGAHLSISLLRFHICSLYSNIWNIQKYVFFDKSCNASNQQRGRERERTLCRKK